MMLPANLMSWTHARDSIRQELGFVYPSDTDRADVVLTAVNCAVWLVSGGLFDAPFTVGVQAGGEFWAPRGYGAMQAINVDGEPAPIRGKFYEFHLNGPGSGRPCNWCTAATQLLGIHAAMDASLNAQWFTIGVLTTFPESQDFRVLIEGVDINDCAVATTTQDPMGTPRQVPGVVVSSTRAELVMIQDVRWKSIRSIRKRQSLGVVKIFAFPEGDVARRVEIAELPAYYGKDNPSVYTRYLLGTNGAPYAKWSSVLARFKLAEPVGPMDVVLASSAVTLVPAAIAAREVMRNTGEDLRAKRARLMDAANHIVDVLKTSQSGSLETPEMPRFSEPPLFDVP